jgi:RimJ/RimL family protein N-acetyltransferase
MVFLTSDCPVPIGYAELNDMPSRADELWIGHFIIAPERRGMGLCQRMLRLLLDYAFRRLGAYRAALIVFPGNEPAIRCYTSGGLAKVGRQDKVFAARPGVHGMIEMAIDQKGYEALIGTAGPSGQAS